MHLFTTSVELNEKRLMDEFLADKSLNGASLLSQEKDMYYGCLHHCTLPFSLNNAQQFQFNYKDTKETQLF